ncbi:MAG TPA: hypothetical protein VIM46_00835 [Luteolibacter sp.]
MKAKRTSKWGWLTAFAACAALWAVGLRPFGGHASADVPLEVQAHRIREGSRDAVGLTVKNAGNQPLHGVEILGLGEADAMRIFRRQDWAPGEAIELGSQEGWMAGTSATVEVSAQGYASKKLKF